MNGYIAAVNKYIQSGLPIDKVCKVVGKDSAYDVIQYGEIYNFVNRVTKELLYKKWWFTKPEMLSDCIYTARIIDGDYVLIDTRKAPTAIIKFFKKKIDPDYVRNYVDKHQPIVVEIPIPERYIIVDGNDVCDMQEKERLLGGDVRDVKCLSAKKGIFIVTRKDWSQNIFNAVTRSYLSDKWFDSIDEIFRRGYRGFIEPTFFKISYGDGTFNIFSIASLSFAVEKPYMKIEYVYFNDDLRLVQNYQGKYNIIRRYALPSSLFYAYETWFDEAEITKENSIKLWNHGDLTPTEYTNRKYRACAKQLL